MERRLFPEGHQRCQQAGAREAEIGFLFRKSDVYGVARCISRLVLHVILCISILVFLLVSFIRNTKSTVSAGASHRQAVCRPVRTGKQRKNSATTNPSGWEHPRASKLQRLCIAMGLASRNLTSLASRSILWSRVCDAPWHLGRNPC